MLRQQKKGNLGTLVSTGQDQSLSVTKIAPDQPSSSIHSFQNLTPETEQVLKPKNVLTLGIIWTIIIGAACVAVVGSVAAVRTLFAGIKVACQL